MSALDLQKHTLNLRSGDWEIIEAVAQPRGIATSFIVRTLVSQYVDQIKRKIDLPAGQNEPNSPLNVEIDID